jgi:hypothetical protein
MNSFHIQYLLPIDTHPERAAHMGFRKLPTPPAHVEPAWGQQIAVAARNMVFGVAVLVFTAYLLNKGTDKDEVSSTKNLQSFPL